MGAATVSAVSPVRRIALVSFDLDGTLVDTAGEIAEAANRALHDHGLPRQPVAELTLLIGHGAHALMRQLLARLGAAVDAGAALASFERHYRDTTGTLGLPYPGCAETLQRLRAAGVPVACVTNKEARLAHQLLRHHGLDDAFALVIGGDTLPQKKPHASVLQHVAAALAVPMAQVAHVGDSATDVLAARNAGAAAWAVPWGYNGGQPIQAAQPDRLFQSLPAIADHVLAPPSR
jgi:phosphoglycolate phosphatase